MNALRLEILNSSVPYIVKESLEQGFYEFVTTHGVRYSIGFMKDDLLMSEEAYQLIDVIIYY